MCGEAVNDSLAALKLVFDPNKMIQNHFNALHTDESILLFNGMGILNIDIENNNLDNNFDEDGPDTIILIRLLTWSIIFKKRKELKKKMSEELMPIAWHPNKWWKVCLPEDDKKRIDF